MFALLRFEKLFGHDMGVRDRQSNGKRRAFPLTEALGADRAVVRLHDLPDDREAKAEATMWPYGSTRRLA